MPNKIIQSPNPDIDTLKCPKCGAIWRSEGYYDYDEGGWVHEQDTCPNECRSRFLNILINGKVIPRD
jgi:hypothetical protein